MESSLSSTLSFSSDKDYLNYLQQRLPNNFTVNLTEDGRLFYWNLKTRTSSWLPPIQLWEKEKSDLPYGWEMAHDDDNKIYFINHLNKTTTYEDPRKTMNNFANNLPDPTPREVTLVRDAEIGFGFVVGNERPVMIRYVKEGGPSEGKLISGDQILKVNGEDMFDAPREEIIRRVKCSENQVTLLVCQPNLDQCQDLLDDNNNSKASFEGGLHYLRSALLTEAKKARLRLGQPRVRFSERISIDGNPLFSQSPCDSPLPVVYNVLKVYLENNQTRTFKYDTCTTVQDVLNSLIIKLGIKCPQYYTLCTEHIRSHGITKLTILSPEDIIWKVAAKPGAHSLRCILRMTFVSTDIDSIFESDRVSFDYLYDQCCNDYVAERYSSQLNYDTMINLGALQLLHYALINSHLMTRKGKVDLKKLDKSLGLSLFLPESMVKSMKRKDLYKLLSHYIKELQVKLGVNPKSDEVKTFFLEIVSSLPGYGAKAFPLNAKDNTCGATILISPKFALSQLHRGVLRQSAPATLAQFDEIVSLHVTRDEELGCKVVIILKSESSGSSSDENDDSNQGNESDESDESNPVHKLTFMFDEVDVEEFVMCLRGYHRLFTENKPNYKEIQVTWDLGNYWWSDSAPNYHDDHLVCAAFWNYPQSNDDEEINKFHKVNFFFEPPSLTSRKANKSLSDPRKLNVIKNRLKHFTMSSLARTAGHFGVLDDIRRDKHQSDCILDVDEEEDEDEEKPTNEDFLILCEQIPTSNDQYNHFLTMDRLIPESSSRRVSSTSTDSVEMSPKIRAADSLDLLHQIHEQTNSEGVISSSKKEKEDNKLTLSFIPESSSPISSSLSSSDSSSHSPKPSRNTFTIPPPSGHPKIRSRSGSSFGLTTLDSIPNLIESSAEIAQALRKFQDTKSIDEAKELEVSCAETTFYLGSDVIDLTSMNNLSSSHSPVPDSGDDEAASSTSFTSSKEDEIHNQALQDASGSDSGIEHSNECQELSPPTFTELLERSLSNAGQHLNDDDDDDLYFNENNRLHRKSLEEIERETMEQIENVSKKVKKMYLLEIDESSEAYWES